MDPTKNIGLASNLWFSIASVLLLTLVVGFISERVIEPRLGTYQPTTAVGDLEARTLDRSVCRLVSDWAALGGMTRSDCHARGFFHQEEAR